VRQTLYSVFACITLLTVPATAQYTIGTIAGGVSGNGLTATSQATGSPEMAVDPSGNLYFVLFYEARVYKLNANGTLTLVAGNGSQGFSGDNGPATSASLNFPNGLAVDAAGNVYIADSSNNRVRKVSNGTITTIAGNGTPGFFDGPAASASFNYPQGLALDSSSNLYIVDANNNRVRRVSNGIVTTLAGNGIAGFSGDNGSAANAQLNSPRRIALDGAGNLYIADTGNQRVRKVSTTGIITTVAGNGSTGFNGDNIQAITAALNPTGLAVDSPGTNLYIADASGSRVRKVSGGIISTAVGTGTAGFNGDGLAPTSTQLRRPLHVAVDSSGNLYVADEDNNRVRKISSNVVSTVVGGGNSGDGGPAVNAGLSGPYGVTLDASGSIYIADTSTSRIRKIANGVISTIAGNGTNGYSGDNGLAVSAAMNFPQTVVADNFGNVYIADSRNSVIRKVTNGTITTVAGNGVATFAGDNGPATSASLNLPLGVGVDSSGDLYIADTYNQRIRKVSKGAITTIAGNGTAGFSGDNGLATSAQLNFPQTISFDSSNNLYIVDYQNGRTRKVSLGTGIITTVAGGGSTLGDGGAATSATLFQPEGAILDNSGDLFISDTFDSRIREVSEGVITTVGGNGFPGFSGDGGPATSAQINNPVQLARDPSGKLYFADANNGRIRVLTPVPPGNPPSNCSYTVSPIAGPSFSYVNNSFLSFGFAGGNAVFSVTTQAGCSWNAVTSSSFITITGSASVSGTGQVAFTVAPNISGSARSGAIVIAGQTFFVSEGASAGSLTCSVFGGVPPIARVEALADEYGDIVFQCTGVLPPGGIKADVQAFFNTNVTSRFLNTINNSSEALLLFNEPANPVVGTNAFPGLVVSANSVLFPQVQIPANSQQPIILRLTNVRLNATILGAGSTFVPTQVVAFLVLNSASVPTVVNNPTQIVGFIQQGVFASKGSQTPGPDPTTQVGLPLNFREGFSNAFRPRLATGQDPSQTGAFYNSESGFVNTSVFGSVVGFADTGSRVLARFTNIPSGLRVFASLVSTSASSPNISASLVSADGNGAGGTFILHFAPQIYHELTVVKGSASATWEITSSDPFSLETLQTFVYFQGVSQPPTPAQLGQIVVKLSPAPLSTINTSNSTAPLPRFVDTATAQPLVTVKVTSQLLYSGSGPSAPSSGRESRLHPDSVIPGSNITFVSVIQNLGSVPAPNVVVHDNLPSALLLFNSCSLDEGQTCQGSGNDLRIALAGDLLPGQSRTISINAKVLDVADGTLGLDTLSVTSDLANLDLGTSTIPFVISKCTACVPLTLGTNPPGLQFMADGALYTQTAVQPVTSGLAHILSVDPNPQVMNSQQYRFAGWSNGVGTPSQSVVISSPTTITANFGSPLLGIQMNHSGNFALGQSGAVYMVSVSNAASALVTSGTVTVTEVLPAGLTLAGMSGSGWMCTGNTCTRSDTLSPGVSFPAIVVRVNVLQTATSPQANQVTVSGGGSATTAVTDPTTIVTPALSLSRSVLNFGASSSGVSSPQQVAVNFSSGGALNWTASPSQSNIIVSSTSGTGNAVFQVSVTQGPAGVITVSAPGATNSPQTVQVNIANVTPAAPFGSFDTPANNTSGVVGAIPVTGWALDNVEVTNVDVLREPVPGEPAGNLIFVGTAVFVADARPDVQALYPSYPNSYRAGWGYQMLTNFLPNSSGSGATGNGTYKIHAIAHNKAGGQVDLGTKTIVVDNAHAAKPFGTLDTPTQGGTVSGTDYVNFGWALTPQPAMIPTDGSTMTVVLDGQLAAHPTYNNFRSDIATLFPGYANSMAAVGFFHLNTTTLANGVHTISWNVFDSAGHGEGLGSRYFNVLNTSAGSSEAAPEDVISESATNDGVRLRNGLDVDGETQPVTPDPDGVYAITMEEVGRIELHLGATSGNMHVLDETHSLPIGSTLKGGVFYWQAGPGFLGEYTMQFERPDGTRIPVRVNIVPKRFP
jgi:uncharacterized repeat protein (TIGR01451 family)